MGFKNLASLLDHNNFWANTLRVQLTSQYRMLTDILTHREQRYELRSALRINEVSLSVRLPLGYAPVVVHAMRSVLLRSLRRTYG